MLVFVCHVACVLSFCFLCLKFVIEVCVCGLLLCCVCVSVCALLVCLFVVVFVVCV